jgi:hypothetical protein
MLPAWVGVALKWAVDHEDGVWVARAAEPDTSSGCTSP